MRNLTVLNSDQDESKFISYKLDQVGYTQEDILLILPSIETLADSIHKIPNILPVNNRITSGYGKRYDPFTGEIRYHRGIDIIGFEGDTVYAAAKGSVMYLRRFDPGYGYGKYVILEHGKYQTRYAHLKDVLVKYNEIVDKGQPIALMGSTGRSTSTHLHYEVMENFRRINYAVIRPSTTFRLLE